MTAPLPEPACEQAFDDWLASTILPAEAVNSSAVGDVAREAFCSGWDASRDGGETHELVFTDREARPAKWETRCGRTDIPLEHAISLPAGHYPVTCKACIRIAELERLADEILGFFSFESVAGEPTISCQYRPADLARWHQIRHSGEAAVAAGEELSRLGEELQGDQP